jgi:tripartite-type tricarboxylate transporter receptor subunit TctC
MYPREYLLRLSVNASLWSLAALFFFPVLAFSQASFYEGKTIKLVVSAAPGGLSDSQNKVIIAFLRKYIPGRPDILIEYMPGGGGQKAINHIYNVARPDGLTVGRGGSSLVANAVLGGKGVKYDIDKLIYLGSPNYQSHYVLYTRRELGFNTLEKLRGASGLRIGAESVGHHLYIQGRLFVYVLGLKEPTFITGYSSPELDVAVVRRELDSRVQSTDFLLKRNSQWLREGFIDLHSIFEVPKGGRDSRFAHLPELERFTRSDRERKVLRLWRTLRSIGPAFILPPGTPRERVEILQQAFRRTLEDPEIHQEFRKLTGTVLIPVVSGAIEKLIEDMPREPDIVGLLNSLAGAGAIPPH